MYARDPVACKKAPSSFDLRTADATEQSMCLCKNEVGCEEPTTATTVTSAFPFKEVSPSIVARRRTGCGGTDDRTLAYRIRAVSAVTVVISRSAPLLLPGIAQNAIGRSQSGEKRGRLTQCEPQAPSFRAGSRRAVRGSPERLCLDLIGIPGLQAGEVQSDRDCEITSYCVQTIGVARRRRT